MDFFFFFNDDRLRLLCSSDSPTGVWARVPWGPHVSEGDSLCSTAFRGCDCLLVLRLESEKVLDWQLKLKRGGRRTLPHGRVNSLSGDTSPRWTPAASARPAHGPWISPARSEQQQTTAETALANKPHANLISLSPLHGNTLGVPSETNGCANHSAGSGTCTLSKMPSHCSSLSFYGCPVLVPF